MRVAEIVRSLGGFARRRDLVLLGATPRALASTVHAGVLERPRRGLYATPETSADQRHAASHGGALTCGAALAEWGAWVRDPSDLGVVILDQGHALRRRECTRSEHFHHRPLAPRFGRDDPVSSLGHYLRCAPDLESIACAMESCLALGLVSRRELQVITRRTSAAVRETAAWCRPSAGSGLETIVRHALSKVGVDARTQVRLPGVGAVDLLIGDCLVVELDGRLHHSDAEAFERDRRRDAGAALLGATVLRFSSSQVLSELGTVVAVIEATMARGAHRSASSFGSAS